MYKEKVHVKCSQVDFLKVVYNTNLNKVLKKMCFQKAFQTPMGLI